MSVRRAVGCLSLALGISAFIACAPDTNTGAKLVTSPDESEAKKPSAPAPASTTTYDDPAPVEEEETPTTTEPETAAAVKKELGITWKGQENGYWCGPGSTRMAISAMVQQPPTQQELATLMGTTSAGTDDVGLVVKALNKYITGAAYVVRELPDPPSAAQRALLKKDVLARIGAGFPIVANVISGWRPPGYPTGTIYHYVAVIGYDQSGAKVLIADPAAEGSAGAKWTSVPRTYWIDIEDLGTWIGGKGYTG